MQLPGSPPPELSGGRPPFGGLPPLAYEPPPADVSHIARKCLDIPYATFSEAQKLDIYLPERGGGPFPAVFSIHGGAFARGDKRDAQVYPYLRGLSRGYAVIGVNYRLSGEAVFPAGLQDTQAALRWVRAHADEYSLDPERIVAWGGSSGANYAVMLGAAANEGLFIDPALGNTGPPARVAVVVDWYGPMDFLTMDEQLNENGLGPADHEDAGSPESLYLGGKITDIPDTVRLASPLTYVGEGMPPVLIQHGKMDNIVPFQQSVLLAETIALRAGADRVELDLLDEAGHADAVFETEENLGRVFEFIERRLPR